MGQISSVEGTNYVVELCWIISGGVSCLASIVQTIMILHDIRPRCSGNKILMKNFPQLILLQLSIATFLSSLFYLSSPFQPEQRSMFCQFGLISC